MICFLVQIMFVQVLLSPQGGNGHDNDFTQKA